MRRYGLASSMALMALALAGPSLPLLVEAEQPSQVPKVNRRERRSEHGKRLAIEPTPFTTPKKKSASLSKLLRK